MAKRDDLTELMKPVVESLGFEFWGLEYHTSSKNTLLRIFIDSENGINVDDCAAVSHQVSGVMDVEDPISQEYTLEVSSPGVDRLLFTGEQVDRYRGHEAEIRLQFPFDGRRKFVGILNGMVEGDVALVVGEEEYLLPFEQIDRARLIAKFED